MSEPADLDLVMAGVQAVSTALEDYEPRIALRALVTALAIWAVEINSPAPIVAALIQGIEVAELQKEKDLHAKTPRDS